jgi:uncharacterized protein, YhcH/YjgK/YiaL family
MILDSVKSFEKYKELQNGFEKVYKFIKDNDIHSLEEKRYEIDGENVFCTISVQKLKSPDEGKLEVHDSYIDIHLLLEGSETIGIKDRRECNDQLGEYDEAGDIAFFNDEPANYVVLGPDNLAIVFPADAHAPLLGSGECKKIIFKVKIEKK